jgi:hypothetical protein
MTHNHANPQSQNTKQLLPPRKSAVKIKNRTGNPHPVSAVFIIISQASCSFSV